MYGQKCWKISISHFLKVKKKSKSYLQYLQPINCPFVSFYQHILYKETITVRSSPRARPGGWICLAKGIPRLREFSTYYAAPLKEIFKQRPLFWFWLWCGIFIWKITQSGYSIWGLCYESASPAVNSQDWTLL